jgi:hypothetical protein
MKLTALFTTLFLLLTTSLAYNATGPITYLGSKGALLSSGTTAQGLVFISGTVPSLSGILVTGGIKNETVSFPSPNPRLPLRLLSLALSVAHISYF